MTGDIFAETESRLVNEAMLSGRADEEKDRKVKRLFAGIADTLKDPELYRELTAVVGTDDPLKAYFNACVVELVEEIAMLSLHLRLVSSIQSRSLEILSNCMSEATWTQVANELRKMKLPKF